MSRVTAERIALNTGAEIMGNYPTKAHFGQIHRDVRPYHIHMPNSPKVLHRAAMPSTRQGCAEILGNRYQGKIPLPRIPTYRGTDIAAPKTVEALAGLNKADQAIHMLNGDTHVSQRTIFEIHANRRLEPIIFVGS